MNEIDLSKKIFPTQFFIEGETIFLEGEIGKFAYIIVKGEVEIITEVDDKKLLLNTLSSNDMFGELALIDESPRSASALAKTDVLAYEITQENLQKIIEESEPLLQLLLKNVLRYFKSENDRLDLYQYSQNLENQIAIRHEAMEQAFGEIHNGPLQNLALLMKDIQENQDLSNLFLHRLKALDREIRTIGENLTENFEKEMLEFNFSNPQLASHTIRLGEGTILNLETPLNELFYTIFSISLERDFPHFKNIKIKLRDFQPYPYQIKNLAIKRQICICLEEAICNVGKHAKGATKIVTTSKLIDDRYIITVEDNGCGLTSAKQNKGTKSLQRLMKQIKGKFTRHTSAQGGVFLQMSWSVEHMKTIT